MLSFNRYQLGYLGSLGLYTLSSYLILLRDAFILERLSLTTNLAAIENTGLHLASVLRVNHLSTLTLTIALLGLFYFYFKLASSLPKTFNLLPFIALSLAIVFISFPSLSTDVFDYNNNNRITFVHGQNPWLHPAIDFPADGEIYYGSWLTRSTVYPPVAVAAGWLVYFVATANPILAILGFKALALILFIAIILLQKRLDPSIKTLFLFAANPLILIEFIGNAHNDLLLGFFILLSFYLYSRHKFSSSATSLAAAFLSKFTALIYLPFLLWPHLTSKDSKSFLNLLIFFFTPMLIIFALMGDAVYQLFENLSHQTNLFLKSFPFLVRSSFHALTPLSLDQSAFIAKLTTTAVFAIIALRSLWHTTTKNITNSAVSTMLIYIFFALPMLQPWYLAWCLPLFPLLSSKLKSILLAGSLGLMLHYPVFYISLFYNSQHPLWQAAMFFVIITPIAATLLNRPKWYTDLIKTSS